MTSKMNRVAAMGLVGVLVGAVPIGRLRGLGRIAYTGAACAVGGGVGLLAAGDEPMNKRLTVAALAAGALGGGAALGVSLDRALEGALARRIARPRLAIATASGLVGAVAAFVDDTADTATT